MKIPHPSTIYKQIYAECQPYWHVRDNGIHVPKAYRFAQQLLTFYPQADPMIVLSAILLHDNGYANVPPESQFDGLIGSPVHYQEDIVRLHEVEGAKIARQILTALSFDPSKIEIICEIIDGHDSRTYALSLEDELVKDADKLWRYSAVGVQTAGVGWMKQSPDTFLEFCVSKIDVWFFTPEAKKIARVAAFKTGEMFE
ncbi:MAG: HD domain-containing protein [Chloroflexota bacterium]